MSKMTWGDAIDSSDAAHFIGRENELSIFTDEIQRIANPSPYKPKLVFFIYGQGGVGKTELLKHYKGLAENAKFIVAECNEHQGNIPSVLHRFASQIKQKGHSLNGFFEKYNRYQQMKQEIESDPNAPLGLASFVGQSIARVGLALADEVPILRQGTKLISHDAFATQAGEYAKYISQKWSNKREDIELVEDPIPILTKLFFNDINDIAVTDRVLLCFDNYEFTRDYLDAWLNQIREYEPSINIRMAIACRTPPGPLWENLNNVLQNIPLDIFSMDEANKFLDSAGITDVQRREEILEFSGRLPILMQWLSSPESDSPDPLLDTADIVDRFLRWVKEPYQKVIAVEASVPRFFNLDILSPIFEDRDLSDRDNAFEWLRKQPFIPSEYHYGWQYHSVVRRLMLQYQRRRSSQRYHLIHKRLAEYYRSKLDELNLDSFEHWTNEQAQKYKIEYVYHNLIAAPNENWFAFLNEFILCLKYRRQLARKLIQTLVQPASLDDLDEQKSKAIQYFDKQLKSLGNKRTWEGIELYEYLGELFTSDFPEAKAHLCFLRAEAIREKLGDLDKAIELLNEAIRLDSNHYQAITEMGEIYRIQKNYESALVELNNAIRIVPQYHYSQERKGMVLYFLQRYDEAIDALNKADEAIEDCYVTMSFRGACHYQLNHYEQAIHDLSLALDANPEEYDSLIMRAESYIETKQFVLAIKDLERLGSTGDYEHRRLKNLGIALSEQKKYKKAAKKFIESLNVVPDCAHCWYALVSAYEHYQPRYKMGDLMSIENFPEIKFTANVYLRRGRVLLEKDYEEGLEDMRMALKLAPSLKDTATQDFHWNELGLHFARNGEYEEALNCFENDTSGISKYVTKYNIAVVKALWRGVDAAGQDLREAENLFKELDSNSGSGGIVKYGFAGLEAIKNNKASALRLLEEALELDRGVYAFAKSSDPAWKLFRSDLDFIKLLSSFEPK